MIIKRYSQKQFTFTGRDLVEKLYSEGWKVEQKEYGLKSAAISGIKKVGKLIAKKLDDSSKLDSEKLKKIKLCCLLYEYYQQPYCPLLNFS